MSTLPPLFDIERIRHYIERNWLILTPNNRLRSKILQAWGDTQKNQGISVWQTPRIQVIDTWFTQQWQQLQAQAHPDTSQQLISTEQQRIIWEGITANCGLMQTEAVAKQAANAYNTLKRWNLSLNEHNLNPQWLQWAYQYEHTLQKLNAITPEHAYQIIGNAFTQGSLEKEPAIYLLGFDDLPPLIEQQLNSCSDQLITLPAPNHPPQSLQRVSVNDSAAEMQACAQWARAIITQQPDCRIGVIVPNLGQCRDQVEMAFSAEFEAHSFQAKQERYTLPFNFSAGTPLGDTPLITATLNLLKLNHKQWDIEFIRHCLLSHFWGDYPQDVEKRCQLINKLQRQSTFTVSGDTLRYHAQQLDELNPNSGSLFNDLDQFERITRTTNKPYKHPPSHWVNLFLQQLDALHWPGTRTPDSQEYQQTQLWYQLLETFATLDSVLGPIACHSAIEQLQRMANHTPFQAKVPDSPIQILGILEGASLHFSHCWVMGLHQQAWPPAPAPNSLLPIALQREHNMPHASSLRELAFAQSLTDNYRHCAEHIIVSSPAYERDNEQALQPSQLIMDIPLVERHTHCSQDSLQHWIEQLHTQQPLEAINCEQGPAFSDKILPGGSGMFKTQSDNPFDSFAKYRLKALPAIAPVMGFSAIEKGQILHNALASIWHTAYTQSTLLEWSEQELRGLIRQSVKDSVTEIQKYKPRHLSQPLCELEIERQSQLIEQWIQYEKTRAPFTVIATEEDNALYIGEVKINVRIDRVDQLADGRLLIIDYKTGEANHNAWQGERPKEPQLPLYTALYPDKVKGISFAQINIRDQAFKGLGDSHIAQGISAIDQARTDLPNTWEATLTHWQNALGHLLDEFKHGDCRIEYRDNAALTAAKQYGKDYLRLNRWYEANTLQQFLGEQP